jgi:hypothetical protein
MVIIFLSCDFVNASPPFYVTGFQINFSDIEEDFTIAEAQFYFRNTSAKDIIGITMSFRVYYSDGSYPCYGSNRVDVAYAGIIDAGEAELITVSIDSVVKIYRDLALVADQILVEKIEFADGSVWNNTTGFWQ